VNGRTVISQQVGSGPFELKARLPASPSDRSVVLRWANTTQVGPTDPREAAALLQFLGTISPPSTLRSFPADLRNPDLVHSGIDNDGWLHKEAHLVLAGGPAADLVLRVYVVPVDDGRPQHLRVLVNGGTIVSKRLERGVLNLQAPIPAAPSDRRIGFRWAGTSAPGPSGGNAPPCCSSSVSHPARAPRRCRAFRRTSPTRA
jgi:hypothetical protein